MKVFVGLLMLVAACSAQPNKLSVNDALLMVKPKMLHQIKQLQYVADNFESWSPRKQIENINDLVDMVIGEVGKFIIVYGFDPMYIPDIEQEVDIAGTLIHLNLTDGAIYNMSQIYRNGDVNLFYKDRKMIVEVPIFYKILHMDYTYDIGFEGTSLKGKLDGEVVVVDVNFAVLVDFKELKISLESFSIPIIGAINVKFEGGMVDWMLQQLTDYITGQFKDEVITVVEEVCKFTLGVVFEIINEVLGSIKP